MKINGQTVHINNHPAFGYVATLDGYDGAPDAGHQCTGHGLTKAEAVKDLKECVADCKESK